MELLNNIKKNAIFLFVVTIIILIVLLKDNFGQIINALSSMDYKFIAIAVLFFFFYIFLKSIANYITINNKNKVTLKEAFKHNLIVQFFNGITPFSTGGQPMEIYMLTEHNIKPVEATNISIQNFIFYQIALVLYGILAVGYNYFFGIFPNSPFLRELVLLGFVINTLVAVFLLTILISKKLTKNIGDFFINIFFKIKIIKDKEKIQNKIYNKLDEFHESATLIRKRKGLFATGVFLNFLSLTCLYIIPIFIVFSLHDYTSLNIADTITASAYTLLVSSFVPIPGASGGVEYSFLQFFGNFLGQNVLPAILIVWRFITYYLGMIIGALAFSFEKKVK